MFTSYLDENAKLHYEYNPLLIHCSTPSPSNSLVTSHFLPLVATSSTLLLFPRIDNQTSDSLSPRSSPTINNHPIFPLSCSPLHARSAINGTPFYVCVRSQEFRQPFYLLCHNYRCVSS